MMQILDSQGQPATGKFDVIVVDPPWSYGGSTEQKNPIYSTAKLRYDVVGQGGSGEINRKTGAGIDKIISCVPLESWANENCHLYMWTTNPKLPFSFDVMRAWGFEYKTMLTWIKTRKDGAPIVGGMGFFFRGATEHILFGVKGRKPIPVEKRLPNTIFAERGSHSEKPQAFYDIVEKVSGEGRRLDVFARKTRPNWFVYGNQIEVPDVEKF